MKKNSTPQFSHFSYFSHFSAFTLVELIVVIAVLAVLAAISFSTVANITSGARDSARLADISSMKTALETYSATKGALPVPDNAISVVWSGSTVWSQGTFGDNTARVLGNILNSKDLKWWVEYSYSLANNKREYELATVLEKATSFIPFNKTFAAGEIYEPIVKGNYNGVAMKVTNGSSVWILSVPTIIASDIKDANIINTILAFSKSGNLPASYSGKITSTQSAVAFNGVTQVWSGSMLPKTDSEYANLTTALQNVYSGSFLANTNSTIKSLLAVSGSSSSISYGWNLINTITAAKASYNTTSILNWGGNVIPENLTVSMHFNGNNLVDDGGHIWTTGGGPNTINNTLYFNGNQALKADGTDFTLGTQDFTIDAWVYPHTNTSTTYGQGILGNYTYNSDGFGGDMGWVFFINRSFDGTIGIEFSYSDGVSSIKYNSYIPINAWHHVAVSRSGNNFYLFLDGNIVATKTMTVDYSVAKPVAYIGSYSHGWSFPGTANPSYYYLDDLRFLKGTARWISNFTPPTRTN